MSSQLWRAVITAARWLGYTAGFFADVPAFLKWSIELVLAGLIAASHEPIGTLALVCVAGIILMLWLTRRGPPIL